MFEQYFSDLATNQCQKIDAPVFKNTILLKLKRWLMYYMVRTAINILTVFPNFAKAFKQKLD